MTFIIAYLLSVRYINYIPESTDLLFIIMWIEIFFEFCGIMLLINEIFDR